VIEPAADRAWTRTVTDSTTIDALRHALADRYRIERELGAGGMATVFLARDLKHERDVAIKVMHPEIAQSLGAERFLREIAMTANLRHPHILPLYDSGAVPASHSESEPSFMFYVMPFIDGGSLRDRLDRDKQLPIDEALAIAREVADALGYAHACGVVHRDIKPENILLERGHAVVSDFGIARGGSVSGKERITETGMSLGTPTYMSPEQAAGDRDVDGRSDLYALGCVLYEMLGGQPPFTGPTAESVTRQHLITEPAPITNLRPTVSPEVAGALARTLAKNPADRFNPAAQFVQALTTGAQPMPIRPAAPAARRSPARFGLIAVAGVALIALGWVGFRTYRSGRGAGHIERIAVLPMDNQTGDASQLFFADGMTRELIGVLTDAGVWVLGHRAIASYRNTTKPAAQIAKELQVDALVTGSVLKTGDVVQIAAELTDPSTGKSLWARTFSRPAPDVVTLEHEVALEIARGIRARLTPDQERSLGSARPVNPQAYAQYLLGQEQINLRTPESIQHAIAYLARSIALDSTFAPAWGTYALAHAYGIFYAAVPPDSVRSAVERASARALAIDDQLGDALIAHGMMRFLLDWDFKKADEEIERGMDRSPTTIAQAFAVYFPWETGQFEKASSVGKRIIELEPTTAQWHSDMGWNRWAAGDSVGARAYAREAIRLDSTFNEPYFILAMIDADGGNAPAARREAALTIALGKGPYAQVIDGYVRAKTGDTTGARRVLQAIDDRQRPAQRALVFAALGARDSMYVMFERAIDAKDPDAIWFLNAIPSLRPLRNEPRYQRLLERMGLPREWRR
jgi:serine/threonine-protein kinase